MFSNPKQLAQSLMIDLPGNIFLAHDSRTLDILILPEKASKELKLSKPSQCFKSLSYKNFKVNGSVTTFTIYPTDDKVIFCFAVAPKMSDSTVFGLDSLDNDLLKIIKQINKLHGVWAIKPGIETQFIRETLNYFDSMVNKIADTLLSKGSDAAFDLMKNVLPLISNLLATEILRLNKIILETDEKPVNRTTSPTPF